MYQLFHLFLQFLVLSLQQSRLSILELKISEVLATTFFGLIEVILHFLESRLKLRIFVLQVDLILVVIVLVEWQLHQSPYFTLQSVILTGKRIYLFFKELAVDLVDPIEV